MIVLPRTVRCYRRGNRAGRPRPYRLNMAYDPDKHHRRSIRLPQYDYAQPGVYFVTICTHERECVLGEIVDGAMILNDWGIVADRFWDDVLAHFHGVAVDAHVIMPNHVHANIVIVRDAIRRGEVSSPTLASPRGRNGRGDPAPTADVGADRRLLQIPDHQNDQPDARHARCEILAAQLLGACDSQRSGDESHPRIHRNQPGAVER